MSISLSSPMSPRSLHACPEIKQDRAHANDEERLSLVMEYFFILSVFLQCPHMSFYNFKTLFETILLKSCFLSSLLYVDFKTSFIHFIE